MQADRIDRDVEYKLLVLILAGSAWPQGWLAPRGLFGLIFRSDEFVPVLQGLPDRGVHLHFRYRWACSTRDEVPRARGATAGLHRAGGRRGDDLDGVSAVWALVGQALASQVVMTGLAWYAARCNCPPSCSPAGSSRSWHASEAKCWALNSSQCVAPGGSGDHLRHARHGGAGLPEYRSAARRFQLAGGHARSGTTLRSPRCGSATDRLREHYVRALRMTYAAMPPPAAARHRLVAACDAESESAHVRPILALAAVVAVGATLDLAFSTEWASPAGGSSIRVVVDTCTLRGDGDCRGSKR